MDTVFSTCGFFIVLIACLFSMPNKVYGEYNLSSHHSIPIQQGSQIINANDTIVFDLASGTIISGILTFPVYYISDDPIGAIDFSFNFNLTDFQYSTVSNPLSVDQVLAFVSPIDFKLRLTSNDLQGIAQVPIVYELSFNTTETNICALNIANIATFLNGEPCSYKLTGCSNPPAYAGLDQNICNQSANLSANEPIIGQGIWSLISGQGTFANINNPNTLVTGLGNGTNVFRWTLPQNSINPATFDNVEIIISLLPSPAIVASDFNTCESTIILSATAPFIGTGSWSVIEGSGIINDVADINATVTNLSSGSNTFEWTVNNGNCPSNSAQLLIFRYPQINAGNDTTICGNEINLSASSNSGNGFWQILSGTGVIGDINSSNSIVTSLSEGENIFTWTITQGNCSGITDTLTIIVDCNEPPLIIGENLVVNEDELLTGNILINGDNDPEGTNLIITTIAINGPSNGIFLIESNGDFSYTPSNNFNGLDTILIQICDEGIPTPACGIDTLIISVLPINDSPSVNNELILLLINTNFSGNLLDNDFDIESTSLIASALISNASNGSFTFNPDGSFTYTPNTSFIGFDTVVVSVCDNGFPLPALCSNDTLIFEVTVFPFSVSAGNDTTICGTETQLNASNLELNATGQWSILNGSATIIEINNPNSLITSLNIGLNELIWTVNLNGFIISDTVSITSLENPNQSFAGNDTLICGAQLNLNANQAIVGIGNWTDISGIAVFENENDEQTLVNNLAPGIYTFIWTIQNNDCATRDTLEVSARSIVSVFAGVDTTICPLNNNIEISISITGANSWNWTTISGSGQISSLTSLTPQFSGLGSDENIFLLSAGLIECADLDTLTIQVLPSDNPLCQQNLIFIPDGFSPNGDSSHDLFVIENLNGLNANVHIYNRYGSLVYESRNYQNDWNGTANAGLVLYGEELPEGTYYYIISIEGETENRLNFITLWR